MNRETRDPTDGGLAAGEPDPGFVRNLEWQVRSAARRESRFARPAASGTLRVVKIAAIAAVALIGGASGTLAFQHLQQSRSAGLHVHHAELEFALAHRRVVALEARAQRLERLVQIQAAATAEIATAKAALAQGRTEEQLRRSELDEARASGRAPDDTLFAPRVGVRDFVTERLERRRAGAMDAVEAAGMESMRILKLRAAAVVPDHEVDAANLEQRRRAADVLTIDAKIALRRRFIAGELSAARVELEERHVVLAARIGELSAETADAEMKLARAQTLQQKAYVSQGEVDDAALSLAEAQAALELARDELALIDEEIASIR